MTKLSFDDNPGFIDHWLRTKKNPGPVYRQGHKGYQGDISYGPWFLYLNTTPDPGRLDNNVRNVNLGIQSQGGQPRGSQTLPAGVNKEVHHRTQTTAHEQQHHAGGLSTASKVALGTLGAAAGLIALSYYVNNADPGFEVRDGGFRDYNRLQPYEIGRSIPLNTESRVLDWLSERGIRGTV